MKYLRFQMTKSTFYWNASIYVEFTYKPFLFILINSRYIERCPNINFSLIISYTNWISETYRIFKPGVKTSVRKKRPRVKKNVTPHPEIHPSGYGYYLDIQNEFRENFGQIMAPSRGCVARLKKGNHRF